MMPRLKVIALTAASLAVLTCACGRDADDGSWIKERMDHNNNPADVPGSGSLEYYLPSLPESGSVQGVWTGSWWPLSSGGTAEPLAKYDEATNGRGLASAWERRSAEANGNVSWAGHCNGLAAAGTMTHEPTRSVTYRGVTFSVEDMKGLLVEAWQGGGRIVGGRCNNQDPEFDQYGRMRRPECRGINAGTFHVGLTNFLGRFNKPIIFDVSTGHMVWNYAATSYQVTEQREVSAAEASSLLETGGTSYLFNGDAVAFMHVKTTVKLVSGSEKHYEYIIEGDHRGDVIGGEWVDSSKTDHPDFMWRHDSPTPENPHIDPNIVYQLYKMSY